MILYVQQSVYRRLAARCRAVGVVLQQHSQDCWLVQPDCDGTFFSTAHSGRQQQHSPNLSQSAPQFVAYYDSMDFNSTASPISGGTSSVLQAALTRITAACLGSAASARGDVPYCYDTHCRAATGPHSSSCQVLLQACHCIDVISTPAAITAGHVQCCYITEFRAVAHPHTNSWQYSAITAVACMHLRSAPHFAVAAPFMQAPSCGNKQ